MLLICYTTLITICSRDFSIMFLSNLIRKYHLIKPFKFHIYGKQLFFFFNNECAVYLLLILFFCYFVEPKAILFSIKSIFIDYKIKKWIQCYWILIFYEGLGFIILSLLVLFFVEWLAVVDFIQSLLYYHPTFFLLLYSFFLLRIWFVDAVSNEFYVRGNWIFEVSEYL